uniref:17-beta-hydroxysteroid dehydrogenase type 6 n=1 Tax=Steinernema glaseri TaxID=37863 RepID=A0A1I7ZD96_9BILA
MACLIGLAVTGFLLYYVARYLWELITLGDLHRRAVFISGCDSGFGRLLALKCVRNGIPVFAGCLTKEGGEKLKADAEGFKGQLETIPLDVTSDSSCQEAAKTVKSKLGDDKYLWAVVNNAGVFSIFGPDDWTSIADYQRSYDVNCLGVVRVTHAFKPLIKKSKGRIITVTSVAGRVATPCGGPYNAAKYGAEAYMDTIRKELRGFGITCCILEPGIFKTPLLDEKMHNDRVNYVWSNLSQEQREEYGEDYKDFFADKWNSAMNRFGSERTDFVVDNYYHAITAKWPRLRYRCGWDSLLFYIPISYLPTEIEDWIFDKLADNKKAPAALLKEMKKNQ